MPATNSNRAFLHLKTQEMIGQLPAATVAAQLVCDSSGPDQKVLHFVSNAVVHSYDPFQDAYVQLPSPALTGTFGAGVAARYHPMGPTGTALAGSSASLLNTNLTILEDLRPKAGRSFIGRVTAGTGAGQDFKISGNTTGPNAVLNVTNMAGAALAVALDATSQYVLLTGRFYLLGAGVLAAGMFKFWDYALKTWSGNLATANLPATIGTDSRLVTTASAAGLAAISTSSAVSMATGTSTGTNTTTTLNNTGRAWAVNQWANSQVRITAGLGAGQVRTIASNTAAALTVSAAWTVTPDATSVYSIEGNDDHIYYMGSGAVAMMRYSRSADAWTLLAPTVARAAVPGAGLSAHWIYANNAPGWAVENSIINGRRIYSFRGGGSTALDYYDIASNSWVNVSYGGLGLEAPNSGWSFTYDGVGLIYATVSLGTHIRVLALDLYALALSSIFQFQYTQGAAVLGDKSCLLNYDDALGQPLRYLYQWGHSVPVGHRVLLY